MKEFLKYLGMLIVILGTLYLMLVVFLNSDNNNHLMISGAIIVVGFFIHLIMNMKTE